MFIKGEAKAKVPLFLLLTIKLQLLGFIIHLKWLRTYKIGKFKDVYFLR